MFSEGNYGRKFNASLYNISVPFGSLVEKTAREKILTMQKNYPDAQFYMFSNDVNFDLSTLVIFLMAVSTVTIGSLWSGYAKQNLRIRKETGLEGVNSRMRDEEGIKSQDGGGGEEEEISVRVSPLLIMFFVFCMCSMLVLLYFFFNQLVYVIMAMFCIASSLAMYSCFEPLVMATYALPLPVLRLPRINLYICRLDLEIRQLLLLLISLTTAIVWFIFRKTDWSWILQDFLGIMFSINMLKVLRLPSLKICTCLLSALFFYDIFFVFITPLFMKDGKSVMVEVATGHSSDEQLPMVLRVPHLNHDPCYTYTYSLLGFGDILVPGLLLAFCHGFDLMIGTPCKIYWVLSCICYTLGLVATFISLFLILFLSPSRNTYP
ncbi:signal peptide peptidase-like 2B [Eurytemora carolleeae]|uniref:signal peptide peptidase-like 2B n=1 Tax=Eurytemora carolleeae TaxID=1294199 RepID=UPI000C7784C1|nr:signal peptide peptidase-like 2B [Eurytemora carolleeae]|eukprot:XP_023323238.1 signal peptide peptidase-like 2B [Eurytemora affinis]